MDMQIHMDVGEKLVEKIAGAVEIIYDPYGDKKAYRELVRSVFHDISKNDALSDKEKICITNELRFLIKKNKNRETIISNSIGYLNESARPDLIENSWLVNFWDKAGTVSDEMFQDLWSRILAEEVNKPNTISKRLLHNLSLMSVTDANNFLNLAKFCFLDKNDNSISQPIIYIKEDPDFYASYGIYSYILKELEQFSLIETNYDTGFAFNNRKILFYLRTTLEIDAPRIPIGNVRLTGDGQKLFAIISKSQKDKILDYTVEKLQYKNCETKTYRSTKIESKYTS